MTNIFKNEREFCFSKLKKVVEASGVTLIPMKSLWLRPPLILHSREARSKVWQRKSNASSYAALPTNKITARNGIEYAYREVGTSPVPLLLLQHFRGNLDN